MAIMQKWNKTFDTDMLHLKDSSVVDAFVLMPLLCRHRVPALLVSSICSPALQPRHLSAVACWSEGQLGGHENPGAAQT